MTNAETLANARLIATAPETKRQRDELLAMMHDMLANCCLPSERARALIAECEQGDA